MESETLSDKPFGSDQSFKINQTAKEKYPNPSRYQRNRLLKKIFLKYSALKNKYFIDICGAGEILVLMDDYNMRGEGIDLSEESCDIARQKVSDNISVKLGDYMEIENKKYGLIMMIDVLEHIKDDDLFLKKTFNILEDDGYYLINVPAKMNIFGKADEAVGHYRRYEKEDLIKLLKQNNFEIVEFWSYGFPIFGRIYSFLWNTEVGGNKEENTIKSGTTHPDFMRYLYPVIGKFYWLLNLQELILNTNVGSQYLILCKKKNTGDKNE